MISRSTAIRFLLVPALALSLAGCGAPLSAHWQGFPAKAPSEPGAAAESQDAPSAQEGPDCAAVKCVALTFDDGPGPYTESLLDVLDKHNAKASFFLIGKDVAKYPEIVREELARGHEIGNHTWSHQDLAKLSPAAAQRELSKADEAIQKVTGVAPTLMRPPYGTITESLKNAQPVPVVMWSDDTLDWKTRNAKKTVHAAEDIKPGSIVLMHDIHKSTIAAVPKILEDLGAQGYHFVTVSQLIGEPKPGVGYKTGQHPPTKD